MVSFSCQDGQKIQKSDSINLAYIFFNVICLETFF